MLNQVQHDETFNNNKDKNLYNPVMLNSIQHLKQKIKTLCTYVVKNKLNLKQ